MSWWRDSARTRQMTSSSVAGMAFSFAVTITWPTVGPCPIAPFGFSFLFSLLHFLLVCAAFVQERRVRSRMDYTDEELA